ARSLAWRRPGKSGDRLIGADLLRVCARCRRSATVRHKSRRPPTIGRTDITKAESRRFSLVRPAIRPTIARNNAKLRTGRMVADLAIHPLRLKFWEWHGMVQV